MNRQTLKQAWQIIKATPLVSIISIAGSGLSIAVIMLMVLVYQVKMAPYAPETYRNRTLYVDVIETVYEDGGRGRNHLSMEVVKECFYPLESAEAVTAQTQEIRPVSLPGRKLYKQYTVQMTDAAFWKVFDFNFISGSSYSESDFQSGINRAVITEDFAKEVFGKAEVIGETIIVDFISYTVYGIVKTVSNAAYRSYGDIWIPYTTTENGKLNPQNNQGMAGNLKVTIKAHSPKDYESIRNEISRRTVVYESTKDNVGVNFMIYPISHLEHMMGIGPFSHLTRSDFLKRNIFMLLVLLLVPALNLSGVAQSSMQQRKDEVGLRKSFGATNINIWTQVISENLLITFIGGIIGLIVAFIFLQMFNSFLFPEEVKFSWNMFLQPHIFLIALITVLILNLLSAGIPAYRIARQPIVNILRGNE